MKNGDFRETFTKFTRGRLSQPGHVRCDNVGTICRTGLKFRPGEVLRVLGTSKDWDIGRCLGSALAAAASPKKHLDGNILGNYQWEVYDGVPL